ncbi:hypothetical protein Shyd_56710 [Streptomyces hydrogenans]|uniref:MFS transporter n=2 Tax=Streptomyces hydrogenans TaxID=1873719 RepID=A0ABQ3PH02_9ACTN|nr:hypothetical protein Shyd_56710 [Streptomyces hydrogenans]
MAVGPALAVLGSAYIGKLWLLCVAAALCAVAALCWLPLPRGERQLNPGSVAKTVGELRLGWSLLIHNRPVVLLVSINFSINLASPRRSASTRPLSPTSSRHPSPPSPCSTRWWASQVC